VVKIDPNGNELWKHSFAPTRCFSSIQTDSQSDVLVAETLNPTGGASQETALAKLDVNGNLQWESRVAPGGSEALAVDPLTDEIYLTGLFTAFK
jgi:outer membrane protein assembly factor BamB